MGTVRPIGCIATEDQLEECSNNFFCKRCKYHFLQVPIVRIVSFTAEIDKSNFPGMSMNDIHDMFYVIPDVDGIERPTESRDTFLITFKRDGSNCLTEESINAKHLILEKVPDKGNKT